jgi:hypothetical protein
VSIKTSDQDECPYCRLRFEIAAVRFRFFGACTAVFICRNCGLIRADSDSRPSIAKRIFTYFARRQRRAGPPRAVGAVNLGSDETILTLSRNRSETIDA